MSSRKSARKSLDDDDDDEEDPYLDQTASSIREQQRESARKFLWDEEDDAIGTTKPVIGAGGAIVGSGDHHDIDITSTRSVAHAVDHGYGPNKKKKRQTAAGSVFQSICGRGCRYLPVYIVLAIVVAGFVYALTKSQNGETVKNQAENEAPVAAPVEAPVSAPVQAPVSSPVQSPVASPESPVFEAAPNGEVMNRERFEAIKKVLEDGGHLPKHSLRDEYSPQREALHWLSNQDPSMIAADDEYLLNRYVLAVFFFATGGVPAFGEGVVPTIQWTNSEDWLSDKGYCAWYGVECVGESSTTFNGNGVIIKLRLPDNVLRGHLVEELFAITTFDTVDLSGNQLSGPISGSIENWKDVTSISLQRNGELKGHIPGEIGSLSKLRDLDLSENILSGTIPPALTGATSLRVLSLGHNELQGSLSNVPLIPSLEVLSLDNNSLQGAIPDALFTTLTSLKTLQMSDNRLSGPLSAGIASLSNLERLHLTGNEIEGNLPDIWGELTNLEELHMVNNKLTGPIPASMGSLTKLSGLHLASNQLDGELHSTMDRMTSLKEIYLEKNNLGGSIPDKFGGMGNLEVLKINSNDFTGTVPLSLASVPSIKEIMIHDNRLTGTIASAFGLLPNLKRFTIQSNEIVGTIPDGLCSSNAMDFMAADCKGETPEIACSCCEECF